jgi:DUF4097 and DUF4098 domain-containing protein YvlB
VAQEKWLIDGPKVIDIDNVRRLKIGLIAGQVNVLAHDEAHAHIEVHSIKGKDLLVQVDGDTLVIDHAQWTWDNFIDVFKSFRGSARVDLTISVPRDIALKFGVVSASALISGLTEDASISTISGDVVIDGLYGDVQLNSVSGEVSVRNHYGKLNAHTISGDITAAGEIMKFAGDTVSGDVFLDVQGIPDEIKVNTVSGSVTARLESEVPVQYRINTVSGRLQLDDSELTGVRGGYTGKYGTLDKRWLEFRANTVSGSVSVLHQVSA